LRPHGCGKRMWNKQICLKKIPTKKQDQKIRVRVSTKFNLLNKNSAKNICNYSRLQYDDLIYNTVKRELTYKIKYKVVVFADSSE